MVWAALALSLVLLAGLGCWLRLRMRRRRPVSPQGQALMAGSGEVGIYGLSPRELDDFRALAREQSRNDQERWNRDYPNGGDGAMPGRVAGIPRALRVKR